jgi:hypothetical protein
MIAAGTPKPWDTLVMVAPAGSAALFGDRGSGRQRCDEQKNEREKASRSFH